MANRWSLTGNGGGGAGGISSGSASKECGDEFEIAVLLDRADARSSSSSSAKPRIVRGNRRAVDDDHHTSGVDDGGGRDSDDEERIMILDGGVGQNQPQQSKRCKRNGNAKVKMFKPKSTSSSSAAADDPSSPPPSGGTLYVNPAATGPGSTSPMATTPTSNSTKNAAPTSNNSSSSNNNNHSATGAGAGAGSGKSPPGKHKNPDEECDVIGDLIGDYGKWQFVMTFLLSLFQVPNTFHIYSPTFQAAEKSHWCRRPSHLNDTPVDLWRNVTRAQADCRILNYDWSSVESTQSLRNLSLVSNMSHVACSSWEFDINDNLGNTWASEWSLVCDKEVERFN